MANTKSADFGSANTNKSLTSGSALGIGSYGSITMQAWVKLNAEISSGTWGLFAWSTTATAFRVEYQYNGGTRRLNLTHHILGVSSVEVNYNVTMGTTNWYGISATYAGSGNIEFWVNGVSRGTETPGTIGGSGGANNFSIGRGLGNGGLDSNYASVLVDDVRVWSAVRSNSDIQADYNSPAELVGNETNLRAYYKFNADLTSDETSNNYDLTNNNTVVQSNDIPFPVTGFVPRVLWFQ